MMPTESAHALAGVRPEAAPQRDAVSALTRTCAMSEECQRRADHMRVWVCEGGMCHRPQGGIKHDAGSTSAIATHTHRWRAPSGENARAAAS
jgi:hypothetical protein